MTLRTLNYGNYGIFLIMGNAGFCPSTVFLAVPYYNYSTMGPKTPFELSRRLYYHAIYRTLRKALQTPLHALVEPYLQCLGFKTGEQGRNPFRSPQHLSRFCPSRWRWNFQNGWRRRPEALMP